MMATVNTTTTEDEGVNLKKPLLSECDEGERGEKLQKAIVDENEMVTASTTTEDIKQNDDLKKPLLSEADEGAEKLQVLAPADLPGGFHLVAALEDGRPFEAIVPEGGVKEGELFAADYPDKFLNSTVIPPKGRWRYGLFDCCNKTERFTPMCILSTVDTYVAMAQVMTRLRRNYIGKKGNIEEVERTYPFASTVSLCCLACSPWIDLNPCICALTTISIVNVRRDLRKKYDIPPYVEHCGMAEDICLAACCQPCAVCQISSHTADFDTYPSLCCSYTGLPEYAPLVV